MKTYIFETVQSSICEEFDDLNNIDANELKEKLREPFEHIKNAIKDKCTKGIKINRKEKS